MYETYADYLKDPFYTTEMPMCAPSLAVQRRSGKALTTSARSLSYAPSNALTLLCSDLALSILLSSDGARLSTTNWRPSCAGKVARELVGRGEPGCVSLLYYSSFTYDSSVPFRLT